jgi:Rrf2 family transcriptional regulator, iron-sulfur cluster assembly transcription factor
MRLTTKSRYGTRLVIDLAINSQNGPVKLNDISKRQGMSLKYLEKLIKKLKDTGFVKSVRGPNGGYLLAKPMSSISVGDIVRVLEGSDSITDCSDKENVCGICNRAGECITQWIWMEASEAMFKKLNSFKLDKLAKNSHKYTNKTLFTTG